MNSRRRIWHLPSRCRKLTAIKAPCERTHTDDQRAIPAQTSRQLRRRSSPSPRWSVSTTNPTPAAQPGAPKPPPLCKSVAWKTRPDLANPSLGSGVSPLQIRRLCDLQHPFHADPRPPGSGIKDEPYERNRRGPRLYSHPRPLKTRDVPSHPLPLVRQTFIVPTTSSGGMCRNLRHGRTGSKQCRRQATQSQQLQHSFAGPSAP